jgi:nicotinic acetylcholine receptor, invertebrate
VLTDCTTTAAQLVAANGIRGELLAILNELRFITRKIKEENDVAEETNDWKFAAMVIDRLCFWIFSIYLVAATALIFTAPKFAPSL